MKFVGFSTYNGLVICHLSGPFSLFSLRKKTVIKGYVTHEVEVHLYAN